MNLNIKSIRFILFFIFISSFSFAQKARIKVVVLDENNQQSNKGLLHISGNQVIESYLHMVEKNMFVNIDTKIYYNTGDLVEENKNGNLLFLGRHDTQIKLNGYRIELREIEYAIEKIINAEVQVIKIINDSSLQKLVAFTLKKNCVPSFIQNQLLELIPSYMIPKEIIIIEEFPLNINGKVDKLQLEKMVNL